MDRRFFRVGLWPLGFLVLVSACAFPSSPAPTVVDRTVLAPLASLDRPFVVGLPVLGYQLARFGYGQAISKIYNQSKTLGNYLTVFDWKTGTFRGRVFWEGDHHWRRLGESPGTSSGTHWLVGAGGWARVDPATGTFQTGELPSSVTPSRHATSDGFVLGASRPAGAIGVGHPTSVWVYALDPSRSGAGPFTLPADRDNGSVQLQDDSVDASDRFWINTGERQLYRLDPRTSELKLVYSEDKGSLGNLQLLGPFGSRFLASRYRTEATTKVQVNEVLVFDDSGTLEKTIALPLLDGCWIGQGVEARGRFFLQASGPFQVGLMPNQIWSLDPVAGTVATTGLVFDLWSDGGIHARDDQLLVFSSFQRSGFLTVVRCDLTLKTVVRYELSLAEAVRP